MNNIQFQIQIGKKYQLKCGVFMKVNKIANNRNKELYKAEYEAKTIEEYPLTLFFTKEGILSERHHPSYAIAL